MAKTTEEKIQTVEEESGHHPMHNLYLHTQQTIQTGDGDDIHDQSPPRLADRCQESGSWNFSLVVTVKKAAW